MKSIVEEASSIGKAIEQAWHRAGNPVQFSVKIFEEPKKNIFGFTTQSAKIGFMFDERIKGTAPHQLPQAKQQPPSRTQKKIEGAPVLPKNAKGPAWSPDIVSSAQEWLKQALMIMGLPSMKFEVTIAGNLSKFHFPTQVTGKEATDRMLFSSFAQLMMAALRHKYKRSLQHMKVVFISTK